MSYEDHVELTPGYDPAAFTANIKRHITEGSRWLHKNGNVYTVLMLTNTESDDHYRYPPMVVYRGDNGNVWSRKASDWDRSMTRIVEPQKTILFRVKTFLAAIAMGMSACSQHMDVVDYRRVDYSCAHNDGVRDLVVTSEAVNVTCKNGAYFYLSKYDLPTR